MAACGIRCYWRFSPTAASARRLWPAPNARTFCRCPLSCFLLPSPRVAERGRGRGGSPCKDRPLTTLSPGGERGEEVGTRYKTHALLAADRRVVSTPRHRQLHALPRLPGAGRGVVRMGRRGEPLPRLFPRLGLRPARPLSAASGR